MTSSTLGDGEDVELELPSWRRLVNLALAISALLTFAGTVGFASWSLPSRWILDQWMLPSAIAAAPHIFLFLARVGLNLLLPGVVVLLMFCWGQLHRRQVRPIRLRSSIALTLAWLSHVLATAVPFIAATTAEPGAAMFVFGLLLLPVFAGILLFGLIAAVNEYSVIQESPTAPDPRPADQALAVAISLPVLLVLPMLFAPKPPAGSTRAQNREFETLCQQTGVRFLGKPAAPVRSVAFDWDPSVITRNPFLYAVKVNEKGRIGGIGGFSPGESNKPLDFDYTEQRRDTPYQVGAAPRPRPPLQRQPGRNRPVEWVQVDEPGADLLAYLDADRPSELRKAESMQGIVRYRVTLTDRRSNVAIAEYVYVVDRINNRACGMNDGNYISLKVFLYDAIQQ